MYAYVPPINTYPRVCVLIDSIEYQKEDEGKGSV